MFDEPQRAPRSGLGSLALTRDGAPPAARVYVTFFDLPIHYTRLQIVQRSLSGGFLAQDAALLKANARSMFDHARHHV